MTTEERIKQIKNEAFGNNLWKYVQFCSWCRWYPDLFLDLCKPETGGIHLDLDQRVYLRSIIRFVSLYGVFPRGYSKTFCEELAMELCAIFFPGIELAMTAQTKENAADLIKDKHSEIMRFYPILKNEVAGTNFSKGIAKVEFVNDSKIDNLANAQTSKGQRRRRINIEESALLNNSLFEDALAPIVEVGRNTVGRLGIVDPQELNQQINFFTTSGYRGTDEYERCLGMYKDMVNLNGCMVLGGSWFLPCWYGRGSTKSQILKKKADMSTTAFAQNYESKWVGCADSALVNINKLINCRSLPNTAKEANGDDEYYLGVDVARSQNTQNNRSSIAVVRVKRNKNKTKITSFEVVNIISIPNILNFTAQACVVKKIKNLYNGRMVVIDGNGLGAGLIDECLKESYDPITHEPLGCWNTINDDNTPEYPDEAETCVYNLKAQSYQTQIVANFIDVVDSGKLRLLEKKQLSDFTVAQQEDYDIEVAPYFQTDALFEEIANLKLKQLNNGKLTIEKVVSKLDKDRVSALIYVLWYINEDSKNNSYSSDYEYEVYIN